MLNEEIIKRRLTLKPKTNEIREIYQDLLKVIDHIDTANFLTGYEDDTEGVTKHTQRALEYLDKVKSNLEKLCKN